MDLKTELRRLLNEYRDNAYADYKKRWDYYGENYGDLTLPKPLKKQVYLFPNEKGFLVELFFNGVEVGHFHMYIDEDEGPMNDAVVKTDYRNKGFGKILLLTAIDVSYNYLGYYSSDSRGLTEFQNKTYASLIKYGALNNNYEIDYDKAESLINEIVSKLN
jgi:GNAT superfamily N-acetyltransferase